jgi:FkbM family methyltransferase
MKLKKNLKQIFHITTGLTIYKKLPFGLDPFDDIRYHFKEYQFKTFFDVGANIGQSVSHIRKNFEKVDIFCFEPVSKTFDILKINTANQNVTCYQIALGAQNTEMDIYIDRNNKGSDMNSLKNITRPDHSDQIDLVKEKIIVQTLDDFCSSNSINKIDYLKIDTEGYDLEVLKGGSNFIKNQSVGFIEVEVGMNPENKFHVGFVEVKKYLENFGYRIYGIYEQMQEWPTKTPVLRRVNVLYISKPLYSKQSKT